MTNAEKLLGGIKISDEADDDHEEEESRIVEVLDKV
jgi:hypothetical protein